METKLERKYGLFTAICLVVGIVVGSGVFFKAQTILQKTNGDMPLGILAWIIGGAIMIVCLLAFANMATRFEKVNGLVDYAEAMLGGNYAYIVGWFMSTIYYPAMTSVLAWLSARYTLVFIKSVNPSFPFLALGGELEGSEPVMGPECIVLMLFFLCASYTINAISPKLAGKLQVSATVIKFIPLVLMAVGGIIYGLSTGGLAQNFTTVADVAKQDIVENPLLASVCATAFAYEGWIIATAINAELKDSKKNLPRALVIGGIIIIAIYLLYYIGVAGGETNEALIKNGATTAFVNVFGKALGNILNLFIAISCLGTLNGLMLGSCRGLYSVASRGRGPACETFKQVDKVTNMPNNSAVFSLFVCAFWGFYFYLANIANGKAWFGRFVFDSSEIPIITIYAFYIPIFIMWMIKEKDLGIVKRFIIPLLALAGSVFMVYACILSHGISCLYYLIVFAVVVGVGAIWMKPRKSAESSKTETADQLQ